MKESIYDNMTRCEKEVADLLKEMGIRWAYEQPVFVWDENVGAGNPPFEQEDGYEIQVATDALFSNVVFENLAYAYIDGIDETVTASPDLSLNTTYYWRVRAELSTIYSYIHPVPSDYYLSYLRRFLLQNVLTKLKPKKVAL